MGAQKTDIMHLIEITLKWNEIATVEAIQDSISYVTLFCAVGFIKETTKFVSALKETKELSMIMKNKLKNLF